MSPEEAQRISDQIALGPHTAWKKAQDRKKVVNSFKKKPKLMNQSASVYGNLIAEFDWLYDLNSRMNEANPPPIPADAKRRVSPPPIPADAKRRSNQKPVPVDGSPPDMGKLLKSLMAKGRKAGITVRGTGKLPGVHDSVQHLFADIIQECRAVLEDADLHVRSVEALGREGRPKPDVVTGKRKKRGDVDEYGSPGISGVGAY